MILSICIISFPRHFLRRSTNPHEGQMIAWKLCERMLSMNGLRMNGEFYRDGDNVLHLYIKIQTP